MGEKEQGGMLRSVVVIGIIAMIAAVIIVAVVGLKSTMTKNTDTAVGTVVKTQLPYELANPNISYEEYTPGANSWGDNVFLFPEVGDIPTNNWRDVKMVASSNKKLTISIDISNEFKTDKYVGNDNDVMNKRVSNLYENGKVVSSSGLKSGHTYDYIIKYFNGTPRSLYDGKTDDLHTALSLSSANGSAVGAKINSVEAATYDDKYNK